MGTLFNLARMSSATTGTGTITLGSAVSGYLTFALAGVMDGQVVSYGIKDGANSEVGTGTYTSSGTTLTRTVTKSTNANAAINLSGTAEVYVTARAEDFREKLDSSRTYYVRTDGSDSNTGLADSAGGAFVTIQKAFDVVYGTLDLGNYDVTIQVGNGTYTAIAQILYPQVGPGRITLQGDNTTPSNVVISTTALSHAIRVYAGVLYIKGFKIQTTTTGSAIQARYGGLCYIAGNMDFGAVAQAQVSAVFGGKVAVSGVNYSITGAASAHYQASDGGQLLLADGGAFTVTITGTPAFSTAFAQAGFLSYMQAQSITFSGSATGVRYAVSENSVIRTGGGGASYFPGGTAGTTATGGQYT
jgi:hypothetical protein